MSSPRLQASENGQLLLGGELTLDTVSALATDTGVLFAGDDDINIDLSAVARADSAGVALLVQWQREARYRQRTMNFRHTPSQMLSIAQLCGVDELLALS